jgi:hypothetical protein
LIAILSLVSVVLFAMTMLVLIGLLHRTHVLRNGGGGVAHGSANTTIELVCEPARIGVGWTHSDVLWEGFFGSPTWLLAVLFSIPPLAWLVRHILKKRLTATMCMDPKER